MTADYRAAGGMFMTNPSPNALFLSRLNVNKEAASLPQVVSPPPALEDYTVLAASRPPAPEDSTWTKRSCGGIIPATPNLQAFLNTMNQYAPHTPTSDYKMNRLGITLNHNLFLVKHECQEQWTKKSSYYKKFVQNWGEKLSAAERCLNAPY